MSEDSTSDGEGDSTVDGEGDSTVDGEGDRSSDARAGGPEDRTDEGRDDGEVPAIERISNDEDRSHYRFVVWLFLAFGVGDGLLLLMDHLFMGGGVAVNGLVQAASVAAREGASVVLPVGLVAGSLSGVRFEGDPVDAAVAVGFAATNGVLALVGAVFVFAIPLMVGGSGAGFTTASSDLSGIFLSLMTAMVAAAVLAGIAAYVGRDYARD